MGIPAFVQSNTTVGGTGLTTLNCAFTSNNIAGDMLLCTVRFLTSNGSGTPTITITDSQNNSGWTALAPRYNFVNASGNFVQAFYLLNCKGGANTVTVTITGGTGLSGFIRMGIGEWSNVAAFDQIGTITETAASTAFTPTGITTAQSNELILGLDWQVTTAANPTSITGGFTQRIEDAGIGDVVVADFVGGPITPTTRPTFNWAGSNAQAGYMAAFFNAVFSISGIVSIGGVGVSGATVFYTGQSSGSVTTNSSGNYTIPSLVPGTYVLTPSLDGEIWSPANSTQVLTTSNITGVNFSGTAHSGIGVWAYRGVVVSPVSSDTPGQPNVLYESGAKILTPNADGNIFKMWFGSANGVAYAESNDGLNWARYSSNPVLVPSGTAGAGWNAYPRIFKNSGTYYAYVVNKNFQSMSSWTSTDGITWAQQVANAITPNQTWSGGATPSFIGQLSVAGQISGTWYGYYTAFDSSLNQYVIGQATSTDLLNWTSQSSPVLTSRSPSNFSFQTLGKVIYGWTQIVQSNIPDFSTNGLPSDITRYSATSPAGPFTPLSTSTLYRINSTMGIGSTVGQVADPSIITVNGTTYMYATVTPTGNGAPTNYQIACFTAPLSLQQLTETYEGVSSVPMPGTSTGFAAQLNPLATDPFTVGDTNWTTFSAASGWGAPTFHSGSASGTANGVRGAAFFTALGSASADQWASITLSAVNANSFAAVMCRANTSGTATCYAAVVGGGTLGSSGTAQLFVQKFVNNAFTPILQTSAFNFSVGDVLTLSVIGNTLSVYQNGNLLTVQVDADITSGAPGFYCQPDATATDAAITSFSAGNFAFTIGGNVGVAGASVSDGTNSTTSDANGAFILGPETPGTKTITPTKAGTVFSPLNQVAVVNNQNVFVNWGSMAYSVPDCRVAPAGPNASRNVNGTLIYDVQTSSNHAIPPTDSRAAGAPVDSRVAPNIPQNSRTPGTFGPGE